MEKKLLKQSRKSNKPMSPNQGDSIGSDIRGLRLGKRMTIATLAQRIGHSIGYVSKLERGLSKPSVTALQAISQALGVQVSWFFHEHADGDPLERGVIVRHDQRRRLDFNAGVSDFLLSPNLNGPIELLWSVFEPSAASKPKPYTHEGDEAGLVIEGSLEFWIGDAHYVLHAGDSFAFKSTTPHRYRNCGSGRAIVVWAITPPTY